MRLLLAELLMALPQPVWQALPERLRLWAVDQWMKDYLGDRYIEEGR